MIELLVSGMASFCVAPLVYRLAMKRGIIDVPNDRSSHVVPTARTGGLACSSGVLLALIVARALSHDVAWLTMIGAGSLAIVGFIDDVRTLPAASRLGLQVAVGAALGVGAHGWWWVPLGMIVTPVIVNVVNFMDGINGITSLTMMCWGVTAVVAGHAEGLTSLTILGAVTAGSALGFLPWNMPVARLFPGDVGSYLYGGLVAGGIVYGWANGISPVLLISPLWLYLTDTGVVLGQRIIRRESLFTPHRSHVYQRLVAEGGLPHWVVAVGVASGSAVVTIASTLWMPGIALAIAVTLSALYLLSPTVALKWSRQRCDGRQER